MSRIIEASQIPLEDTVYVKKDFLGYRVVEPIRDPITKKFNWFVFFTGGNRNLLKLLFVLFFLSVLYLGFEEQINNYKAIAGDPCSFCSELRYSNQPRNDFPTNEEVVRAFESFNRGGGNG